MSEHQPPSTTNKPERERILGPKSWTALVAVSLFVIAALVMVAGVLTAKPSFDPTIHTDAIAMANSQQPDTKARSRYPELVEALANFDVAVDDIAEEVVPDVDRPPGKKSLTFEPLLTSLDEDTIGYGFIRDYIIDATAAVDAILERGIFNPVEELLHTPNLANPYLKGIDASGIPVPIGDWSDRLFMTAKEYAFTVAGCAKVLADRGRIDDAAELINRNIRVSDVFLRQATYAEHYHGGYPIAQTMVWAIDYLLAHSNLTEQALGELQVAHARLGEFQSFAHVLGTTHLSIRDDLYRTHTSSGRYIASVGFDLTSPRQYDRSGVQNFVEDVHGRYFIADRDSSIALLEELFKPVGEADAETDIARRRDILTRMLADFDDVSSRFKVIDNTSYLVRQAVDLESEHRARITALGILLAMAEHRLEHAEWPESLDQLVPDYLDTIPINPQTGNPFEYDHTPGEAPSLESFGFEYEFRY